MKRSYEEFEQRIKEEADTLIAGKLTVRETAKKRNCSKSSIYVHMSKKLPDIDRTRYLKVRAILDLNKSERHIRGGIATKNRFLKL